MADPHRAVAADKPALAKHLAWLDETAERLDSEATETEALANGRRFTGGLGPRHYFEALERVEEKRTRATGYRRKALKLRIEENKRRRASA